MGFVGKSKTSTRLGSRFGRHHSLQTVEIIYASIEEIPYRSVLQFYVARLLLSHLVLVSPFLFPSGFIPNGLN